MDGGGLAKSEMMRNLITLRGESGESVFLCVPEMRCSI